MEWLVVLNIRMNDVDFILRELETRKKRELPTQITQRLKRATMLWAHKGWKAIAMDRWAICVVAAQPHLGK